MSAFDVLIVAAHPDDAELHAGGLAAQMADRGRRVLIADATRGEMGTRGDVPTRSREAAEAARILGVERINLDLPDGGLSRDMDRTTRGVAAAIRTHRPALVITHAPGDHHPDHDALSRATKDAVFLANVAKYETGHDRHAVRRLLYFWGHRHTVPEHIAFIASIDGVWERKMAALRAYGSQFHQPGQDGPQTYLTSELFWHRLESRFGFYGTMVGARYGEPFVSVDPLRIDDPMAVL
jgi:bacillithiol biosynthesis deacetylase BshB1